MISLIPFLTGLLCFSPVSATVPADLAGFYQDAGPSGHRLEIVSDQSGLWMSASFLDGAVIPLTEEYQAYIGRLGELEVELLPGPEDLMVTLISTSNAEAYKFVRSVNRPAFLASASISHAQLGAIRGMADGPAKSTASMFRAYLYRIGESRQLIASMAVDPQTGFAFEGLPEGQYRVHVISQASTIVEPVPAMIDLRIDGGETAEMAFSLR